MQVILQQVILQLNGGKIVSTASTGAVSDEGHVHVSLDDRFLSMTGLVASIIVVPGEHTLRADLVASDHGPFRPPVTTSVTFRVSP